MGYYSSAANIWQMTHFEPVNLWNWIGILCSVTRLHYWHFLECVVWTAIISSIGVVTVSNTNGWTCVFFLACFAFQLGSCEILPACRGCARVAYIDFLVSHFSFCWEHWSLQTTISISHFFLRADSVRWYVLVVNVVEYVIFEMMFSVLCKEKIKGTSILLLHEVQHHLEVADHLTLASPVAAGASQRHSQN